MSESHHGRIDTLTPTPVTENELLKQKESKSNLILDAHEKKRFDRARSSLNHSFVTAETQKLEKGGAEIRRLREEYSDSLLNQDGKSISDLNEQTRSQIQKNLEQCQILLPVYNQEDCVGSVLDYLIHQLGISPENILATSCSNDGSDDIIRKYGVELLEQWKALPQLIDRQKFLNLMKANNLSELRGKGLTMLTMYLHLSAEGRLKKDQYIIESDSDIVNMGTGTYQMSQGEPEKAYDPVSFFAWAIEMCKEMNTQADVLKVAKNGRDNGPIHSYYNILAMLNEVGAHYQKHVNKKKWPLTGEWAWLLKEKDKIPLLEKFVLATAYSIETTLNMSYADMMANEEVILKQINIPEKRLDGSNLQSKDNVMFACIGRSILMVIQNRKKITELGIPDFHMLNEQAEQTPPIMSCQELDENPGPNLVPNDVLNVQQDRLIPPIHMLKKEGITSFD